MVEISMFINKLYLYLDLFSYFNVFIVIFIFTLIFFLLTNIRIKLTLFYLVCYYFSLWGTFYSLDGFFLIFLITELTVLLLLFMVYTYIYQTLTFFSKSYNYYYYLGLISFTYLNLQINIFNLFTFQYFDVYLLLDKIISADFFLLYFFLFSTNIVVTTLLILIIGLYSLFFILTYFNLKIKKTNFSKNIVFLRKQNMVKQYTAKHKLTNFQR